MAEEWRIDDLAQRSGISVDTIRFYQREGLLDPPERRGRTAMYGEDHLARLQHIRDLQLRHLSLAAIKALLEGSRLALAESLFATGTGDYTRTQLAEAAGLDIALLDELEAVGILSQPDRFGRDSYDDADLRLLQGVRKMLELGLPRQLVVRLGAIYWESFADMQQRVLELFVNPAEGDPEVLQRHIIGKVGAIMEPIEALLSYCHTRAVQQLTLTAIRRRDELFGDTTPA